jgi:quercetin dioxygenase-like cupin family protein
VKRTLSLLSALACLALAQSAFAQDPAVVNAKTIQVKLENDRVRVLEAVLQPGDKEQLHNHPSYVTYVLAGGTVRIHGADGTVRESTVRTGDVIYRDPVTHWAENIGDTPVRFLLVELKSPAP